MASIWFRPELADAIITSDDVFQQTKTVVKDIVNGRMDIIQLVENMAGVLTNNEAENREKGMRFFTKLLKDLPKNYLTETQVKFISKFYTDRLKDNHRVVPAVLEGYLVILQMSNYNESNAGEFLTALVREVSCQAQLRQDRLNVYTIMKILVEKHLEYVKSLGPDFVYAMISSIDGERDPRNLLFLFEFLPNFLKAVPIGHLTEEMFDVIACYYPIDFHPSPDDPEALTRQDLATALSPCLCAIPEFGEHCLLLLVDKFDSNLRMAKLDSLKLLIESCKTFRPASYGPFVKALWSSIREQACNKADDEMKLVAHQALSALTAILATSANTDQIFEGFVKGIIISMQREVADSTTVAQFVQSTKVLLTVANASKESCMIISKSMIPATLAYYEFQTSPKLHVVSLDFLADLYKLAEHWEVLSDLDPQIKEIPMLCLTAVSQPMKEYQIAGFKTLMKVKNNMPTDLVLPFIEVLIHNIRDSQESDLLAVSVETVHQIARKYPELIMQTVVKGKCDLLHWSRDRSASIKRLNLLCSLASIDEFTQIIIEEMLKHIVNNEDDASRVVEILSESMSNATLYSDQKVSEIESDHGLIDLILRWVLQEIQGPQESLIYGFTLIANTMSSLPSEKQLNVLSKHAPGTIEKCKNEELYYRVLESLYSSVHQSVYDNTFEEIMKISLDLALYSDNDEIRTKACVMIAHFLNKAEFGERFEHLYEIVKSYLCNDEIDALSSTLINLYAWITKGLIMRGNDLFLFWLEKITDTLKRSGDCQHGSEAIRLIMTDCPNYLTVKQHCRISLLYKQRMFQNYTTLTQALDELSIDSKESYYLSWAYILGNVPKSVLSNEVTKISPIVIDALEYDNTELLLVMTDVLCYFVELKHDVVADSLQTILPRLVTLSKYVPSMDVRINSLQCLYDIANTYRTSLLLPYKQDLLLNLAPSLDDKKRLVRNVAVRARTRWYMIGAPGESKEN